ncbi:MAG: radical SAM protein [Prevotellaceae bacterium]|jgi:uncharacterized protein|nr:radical SAM protein [Prevotellaceae bacterium]
MKWSRYNFLFESEKYGFLLYNSLSNSFAELDKETFEFIHNISQSINIIELDDKDLFGQLVEMKALVENDNDEFYNIKYLTQMRRFDNSHLELTINPTLHCNFACPYCFEGDKPAIYMTDDVENAIIDFIKKLKQIKSVSVTWFGGEPLMAFDRIVSLTEKIKKLNLAFSASMISNGYLLDNKVIEKLDELDIRQIQITVDGLKEEHDKRRFLKSGKGTFEKIIANIDNLKTQKPDFSVVVRVNIDDSNKENFIKTYAAFYKKYKGAVYVVPGFITNDTNCNALDCAFDREKKARFLIDLYKQNGVNALGLYPDNFRYECAIRNPYHLTIGPEGELYKCWNDVGYKNRIVGNLLQPENVNQSLLTRYYVAGDPFDNHECRKCFHLPVCGGGCPFVRIESEYSGQEPDICDYRKGHLKEFLEFHYDYLTRINKQNNA